MSHKLSLKCKLLAKCKHKVPLSPSVVVHEPQVFAEDPPPAEPALPSVSPVIVTSASNSLSDVQSVDSDIVNQVKSMFASFAESLEVRFSSIDQKFSQVIPSSASTVTQSSDVSHQDVPSNRSFSAPSPVATYRASA